METETWLDGLKKHNVFSTRPDSNTSTVALGSSTLQLEDLSVALIPRSDEDSDIDEDSMAQRSNIMCIRGPDLFIAVGRQIRMLPLKAVKEAEDVEEVAYKTISTPNITFEIKHMVVNPTGKLLAAVGSRQVAVIVLPRPGVTKTTSTRIECSSIQIGEYYHVPGSSRITKVDWHPWGEGGASLLVLTSDGQLREYDVSKDPNEPQQTVELLSPPQNKLKYDVSAPAEAVSFCIGRGSADWSAFTVYVLTTEGEIWATCPFLPANATPPISYIQGLEYFVNAKSARLAPEVSAPQLKYVSSLKQQLKPLSSPVDDQLLPACLVHAPVSLSFPPARQGPFLLQPAPKELGDGLASDIIYLDIEVSNDLSNSSTDVKQNTDSAFIPVIAIAYSDGKVDVCLDVEKIEAKWTKANLVSKEDSELPMLAVFESINLGLFDPPKSTAPSASGSLSLVRTTASSLPSQKNPSTFVLDPLRSDRVFVTHERGAHRLDMRGWVTKIAAVLRGSNQDLAEALRVGNDQEGLTEVRWLHRTHSPTIASAVLNDVYLAYALLCLDSDHSLNIFELAAAPAVVPVSRPVRKQITAPAPVTSPPRSTAAPQFVPFVPIQPSTTQPPQTYISLLAQPFDVPVLASHKALTKPLAATGAVTADSLRALGTHAQRLRLSITEIRVAHEKLVVRTNLQTQEIRRQVERLSEVMRMASRIRTASERTGERVQRVAERQSEMVKRADLMLRKVIEADGGEGSAEAQQTWAKELARMKTEVRGVNGEGGLKARSEQALHQLELLKPTLRELARANETKQDNPLGLVGLGNSQWLAIGSVIGAEQKSLEDARRRVTELTARLAETTIS
ncbi:Nucleoporin nup82 OS=Schizosaccharomyces pombe (strain 972 / ATCC 24843) GN=nup82 PE=3 SV=1 [Rhizoctonia solani AG-1 IB]|uniref:Nucleoporin nup82 n=1 Tax=Thanatephorus cucumeris (strain AG1-IB / isolate 7/3/14) TaxID=1108050 RepID=A0A0B7FTY2_THACB|nr:Nucleoporin nup82 OS=Schizosaccharomyces pombe (strain 972 / ATCC 24843) GN=nup82 PE=3 SV=1 [Rhizoctonia solani AG-1 IB]